jgi:hypothetical protein
MKNSRALFELAVIGFSALTGSAIADDLEINFDYAQ